MFERAPFEMCPECRTPDGFGILSAGGSTLRRRCRTCRYAHSEVLPDLDKKVVYLDQFAISEIFKVKAGTRNVAAGGQGFWEEVEAQANRAYLLQQVIFPNSDIHRDETIVSPFGNELALAHEMLSGDVSFNSVNEIELSQTLAYAEAYLQCQPGPHLDFEVDDKRVARAVENADGVLLVTSSKPPPPTLASGLTLTKDAVRSVPYLTEDDVGQIVSQAGGDRRAWGRIVFVFCGGHPQLVDARVMGLRNRGWPTAELADIAPLRSTAGDLEEERTAVRTRLLRELDVDSRELLLRLSLLVNNFDRTIMFTTSGVPPAVAQAGILFDALVGPWIEQVGPARYRLSPLLRESGEAGLTMAQRTSIRSAVVDYLMTCRPFPADQLMQVFIFAYVMKHIPALTWFSAVLMHASSRDKNLFKRLSEEVSVFAIADRGEGELLVPENIDVSAKLRYAQFRVAIAIEDGKRAAIILDRLLSDIEHLAGDAKESMKAIALGTALMERSVPLPPKRWLNMLGTLVALPSMRSVLRQRPARTDPLSGLTLSASSDEMLFINRATALDGIDQLCEFVEVLDSLAEPVRDRYLAAATGMLQSNHHIVASAWLSAVRAKGFDGKAAAAKLATLRATASRWKNTNLAIELSCAQAVMLDEYANDKDGALSVLKTAQVEYPQDYRINRQRQKVYYRNGDHGLALAEFESFANALPRTNPVDQAFAMREAGRSAAEIGDLDKTRVFFEQAWEAARRCGEHMRPLTAGLSADCAILDFKAGKKASALALMLRALEEAELIDPNAGLKEHYTILIITAAILWMRGGAADWPVERQAMVIGMCSKPTGFMADADWEVTKKVLVEAFDLPPDTDVSKFYTNEFVGK